MNSFFDYSLGNNKKFTLRPRRWHLILLIVGVGFAYYVVVDFHVKKQKEATLHLVDVSMNYAKSQLDRLGPLRVEGGKLYAGDRLLNRSNELVDSVQAITGMGCTIFMEDERIATTVYTHDSTARVLGTKSNKEVSNRVLQAGKIFRGSTVTLGRTWLIVYEPLRDANDRIIGMIATFQSQNSFIRDTNKFKLFLAGVLLILSFLIVTAVELSLRWGKLIENQHFVLNEKNKQLKSISDDLKSSFINLKASEEKFRDFFENSYDLIQTVSMDGKYLYVNNSWLQTLKYEQHEIIRLKLKDIVHPDYQQICEDLIKRAAEGEEVSGADIVFLTKERDAILLNGNIHCEFVDGVPVATRGVFRNDTKSKLAQQKLRESEKQYRFLVESANDLIFRTDYKGNFTYANEIVLEVTGYSNEEFLSKNYIDLVRDMDRARVISFYQKQFEQREELSYFEFQIKTKTGEYKWLGQNVKIIFKETDRNWIEGFLIVSRDITDRKLKEQQINLQNKQLEDQNRSIKQSIRYAKRIQDSILPNENELSDLLPESFVVFKPKDIVSGDFYWISQRDDYLFVAVADCTGHGVPAAFMSIIGNNQLNLAINRRKLVNPVDILHEVQKGFKHVLKRPMDDLEIQDGMDIAICSINRKTQKLEFAGAFNDLYTIRKKKLRMYRGTRITVGGDQLLGKDKDFELHSFKLQKGDMLYLFSDGYVDQFGGKVGRKLGYDQFRDILMQIHEEPMLRQKRLMEETMEEWQGDEHQIDDICVLGIRI